MKRKDSLETLTALLRFSLLNLKYLGWSHRQYIKTAKNVGFCEGLLSENDFDVVLVTFCCYDYGANNSVAIQKKAADQKDYLILRLCCSLLNSQSKKYQ